MLLKAFRSRASLSSSVTTASTFQASSFYEPLTKQAIAVVDGPINVGRKAVAARDLKKGTVINEFSTPVFRQPTMHTVCLTQGVHVVPTFGAEFISHACGVDTNVNMMVQPDAKSVKVVVTKDTTCGADLHFNYNTTEWMMSSPFHCTCHVCQAQGASRIVRGFAHLTIQEQDDLMKDYVSPYIRFLVNKQRRLRTFVPEAEKQAEGISLAI